MSRVLPFCIGLMLLALPAQAARLQGQVRLGGGSMTRASIDPYPAQLGSLPVPHEPQAREQDVVIELRAEFDVTGERAPRKSRQMAQEGQAFEPHVLAIPVGSTVEFPNFDPVFHNVFSYSKTKKFDLGRYGRGSSKSVTFDKPGIVKVFCDIHSNMAAFIYVAQSPWVTQPGETGAFSFTNLPAGTYELTAWHPERGETSRRIVIDDADAVVDLDL